MDVRHVSKDRKCEAQMGVVYQVTYLVRMKVTFLVATIPPYFGEILMFCMHMHTCVVSIPLCMHPGMHLCS